MKPFWEYTFNDTAEYVSTFDELPLWSASFGLLLLKHIELKPYEKVLDIGSGAGFPLLELAERLGAQTKCYGLDPWKNANDRARTKIKNYEVSHAEIVEGTADKMPFADNSIDLIVSNLGINNFDNPSAVFNECRRVLKPEGRLTLTTNLNGHWKEFYDVFINTCRQLNKPELVEKLNEQQVHRGTVSSVSSLFTNGGFEITRTIEEKFEMRFLNGSALLNHHFVKLGWLSSWQSIIPQAEWPFIFGQLEKDLDQYSIAHNGLTLTVPMAFIEGKKSKPV